MCGFSGSVPAVVYFYLQEFAIFQDIIFVKQQKAHLEKAEYAKNF